MMGLGRHTDQENRFKQWMEDRQITEVHVVSPHLDDAAFSLAELLRRPGLPNRKVFTVFTEAGPSETYAQATGFTDATEEFAVRQKEDHAAMECLGVSYLHCGAAQGQQDQQTTQKAVPPVLDVAAAERLLVLLPLGAGRPLSGFERLIRKVRRMPVGSPSHSEHIWVRDQFRTEIKAGPLLGYYAEVPYQWANSAGELLHLGREMCGADAECVTLVPDAQAKLLACQAYESQIVAEFGARPAYQLRTAGIPERIFLPG